MALMDFTPEQMQLAAKLDAQAQKLFQQGKDDITVFAEMADAMPDFKRLMDLSKRGELEELCQRFPYFDRYVQILETIATGIQSGDIQVPR